MKEQYTKVFTDSAILVNRLHFLLNEAGISCRLSDNVESARLGGFGIPINSVALFVLNDEIHTAQPIIDSFREVIQNFLSHNQNNKQLYIFLFQTGTSCSSR